MYIKLFESNVDARNLMQSYFKAQDEIKELKEQLEKETTALQTKLDEANKKIKILGNKLKQ